MRRGKTFFALILLVSVFILVDFFDFDFDSYLGSASLVLTEGAGSVAAGEPEVAYGHDNFTEKRTEVLSDTVSSDPGPAASLFDDDEDRECTVSPDSRYYLARFADGGDVMFSYGEQNRWPIASISKLMSAVVVSENIGMDKTVQIDDLMLRAEGSAGEFKAGEKFSAKDLLEAAMLASSNDAIESLAMDFGRNDFIGLMNRKAAELRMEDTFFVDPTGLSEKNQSTVNDIYRLMNYILSQRKEILDMTKLKYADIIDLRSGKKRRIANINEFAGRADFLGGKTGFIPESGGNLVSVFELDGQRLITVVFDSADRFGSTRKILQCLE